MKTEKIFFQKTLVVWAGALICCLLWGSAFPCIKIGYALTGIESNETACQILYAGMRFTIAGIMAIILGSFLQKQVLLPSESSIPKIIWLSFLQTVVQYIFFYVGLAHTSGVKASIIEGMNVFVAIVVAALIFHQETINSHKAIGCIIGFVGVVLVNLTGSGLDIGFALNGEGFIFLSTVSYAFSSVFLKKYSNTENPVMLSGYQFIIGGIIMMLVGYVLGGRVTITSFISGAMLLYLAFISAVAYSLWGILLKHNPVSRVAVFGFMNPVFGFILSALLLQEGSVMSLQTIVALLLVCMGIYIVNSSEKNRS